MASRFGMFSRTVTFVQRYRQILFVMLKYGFEDLIAKLRLEQGSDNGLPLFKPKRKTAEMSQGARLRLALEELGPTFVKMGQTLSTRSDLLSADIVRELAQLQDHVPPFPADQAKEILERELGKPLAEVFAQFGAEPLAAGSIGQVHRARTLQGEEVVVKIQRPGIRRLIHVDLEIIHYIASLMERHLELGQLHKPTRMAEEFTRTLEQELDYSIEAANIQRFAKIYEDDAEVKVPRYHRDLSTDRVMTLEFVDGIKPNDRKRLLDAGLDPTSIARKGADLVIGQVFTHGFFHADPHPGNLMVLKGNAICFLDFGMMGRLDRQSREIFADLLLNVISQNEVKAAESLLKLTHGHALVDRQSLERDIAELIDHYLFLSLKDLHVGKLIRRLLDLTVKYELMIPAQFFLLIKAISQIEDLGRSLDPDFDFTKQAAPYIRQMLISRYHPKRILRDIYESGSDLVYLVREVPGEIRELLKQVRQGQFKVEIDHQGLRPLTQTLERISNRVSSAIVLASMIVGSSLIVHARIPPVWHNMPVIGLIGYIVSGIMALSLLRSISKSKDQ